MDTYLKVVRIADKKEVLRSKIGTHMEPRYISTCNKNGKLLLALTYNSLKMEGNIGVREGDYEAKITIVPHDLSIYSIDLSNKTVEELEPW